MLFKKFNTKYTQAILYELKIGCNLHCKTIISICTQFTKLPVSISDSSGANALNLNVNDFNHQK